MRVGQAMWRRTEGLAAKHALRQPLRRDSLVNSNRQPAGPEKDDPTSRQSEPITRVLAALRSFAREPQSTHAQIKKVQPSEQGFRLKSPLELTSYILANIWLKLNKQPLTEWPEEVIGETSVIRDEYLTAIHAADSGDYAPLIELHRRYAETK